MNFRTTLILLMVLAALGAALYFTRNTTETSPAVSTPRKLISLSEDDITGIELQTTAGEKAMFQRASGTWNLTSPVAAPADQGAVQALLSSLLALDSLGQVAIDNNASALGLDHPSASIRLTPNSGQPVALAIGSPTGTGGNIYVRLNDSAKAELVAAALMYDLEKPITRYRDARLIRQRADEIQQLTITQSDGQEVAVEKRGEDWRITWPFDAPAERSAVDDLIRSLTSLRAENFVAETGESASY